MTLIALSYGLEYARTRYKGGNNSLKAGAYYLKIHYNGGFGLYDRVTVYIIHVKKMLLRLRWRSERRRAAENTGK